MDFLPTEKHLTSKYSRSIQLAASPPPAPLRYLSGRVFVLDLTPGSQAHADGFVRPGDIIDEINGTSLRNSKNKQVSRHPL